MGGGGNYTGPPTSLDTKKSIIDGLKTQMWKEGYAIRLLENKVWDHLHDYRIGKAFLNNTQQSWNLYKLYIKIKSF